MSDNRVFLTTIADFPESGRAVFKTGEHAVLVIRSGETFYAVENRCAHLGLPLAGGKVEDDTITCPFHGSRFSLKTGENLDWVTGVAGMRMPGWSRRLLELGKSPAPLPTFKLVVEEGKLYLVL